jgi:hypothetical protein
MKIYSVSYALTIRDNGHCVSFMCLEQAKAFARELRDEGAYSVRLWST